MKLYNDGFHVSIFGSARFNEDNIYYKQAYKLAKILAQNDISIVTGGSDGIMQAANKGAYEVNPNLSIGINIVLPHEQELNSFVGKSATYDNFKDRKDALSKNSGAFVIFPGGFGTLDELFEILVLKQTKFRDVEIILFGSQFYAPLLDFFESTLLLENTISKDDLKAVKLYDEIEDITRDILKFKELNKWKF